MIYCRDVYPRPQGPTGFCDLPAKALFHRLRRQKTRLDCSPGGSGSDGFWLSAFQTWEIGISATWAGLNKSLNSDTWTVTTVRTVHSCSYFNWPAWWLLATARLKWNIQGATSTWHRYLLWVSGASFTPENENLNQLKKMLRNIFKEKGKRSLNQTSRAVKCFESDVVKKLVFMFAYC